MCEFMFHLVVPVIQHTIFVGKGWGTCSAVIFMQSDPIFLHMVIIWTDALWKGIFFYELVKCVCYFRIKGVALIYKS